MAKTSRTYPPSRTYPHLLSGLYPWPLGRNPNGKVWGYERGWIPDPALKSTRKNTKEVKAVVEEVKVMALVDEIKAKADEEVQDADLFNGVDFCNEDVFSVSCKSQ